MKTLHSLLQFGVLLMTAYGGDDECAIIPDVHGHVIIPTTWTYVGNGAFEGCDTLQKVTIPDTVREIQNRSFRDCGSLSSVDIPDSVTKLGVEAFSTCKRLLTVSIGDRLTSISDYAFTGCESLSSMTLPDSIVVIGQRGLHKTNFVTFTIPDSVTGIGIEAFLGIPSLVSVYIPEFATIENNAFPSCLGHGLRLSSSLNNPRGNVSCIPCAQDTIAFPDTVTAISDRAYSLCKHVKTVIMGNNVASIGQLGFNSCENLTSVTMPNTVTFIGYRAFLADINLRTISISTAPSLVIDRGAFSHVGCSTSLLVRGANLCNCDPGSCSPTHAPTDAPSGTPTDAPSDRPTVHPTDTPTNVPSTVPTDAPNDTPTDAPSDTPTAVPTHRPTDSPTASPAVLTGTSGTERTKDRAAYTAIYVVGIVAACMGIYTFVYLRYGGIKAVYRRHRGCEHVCSNNDHTDSNDSTSSRCGRTPYGRTSFCRDHLCTKCDKRERCSGDVFCEGCQHPIYLNMYDELPDVTEYAVKNPEQEVKEGHAVVNPVFDSDAVYQSEGDDDDSYLQCT